MITARDAIGRITARTETVEGVETDFTYAYDNLGRLTDVTRGGVNAEHYEYDANGNRTKATSGATVLADVEAGTLLVDGRDRLRRYGNQRYFYNAIGQLTSKDTGPNTPPTTYTYDALGALRRVVVSSSGTVIDYVIDGSGRRVGRKVYGNFDRKWIYLDDLRPVAELNGANVVTKVFVYGTARAPDLMIIPAGQPSAGTYRLVSDRLGSIPGFDPAVEIRARPFIDRHLHFRARGKSMNSAQRCKGLLVLNRANLGHAAAAVQQYRGYDGNLRPGCEPFDAFREVPTLAIECLDFVDAVTRNCGAGSEILYVTSELESPAPEGFSFIGYDLGVFESGYNVFSILLNEVLNGPIEACRSLLNSSGLLAEPEQAQTLLKERARLTEQAPIWKRSISRPARFAIYRRTSEGRSARANAEALEAMAG